MLSIRCGKGICVEGGNLLQASSVPEVVRPLYESSEIVAKKMIVSVSLFHVKLSMISKP